MKIITWINLKIEILIKNMCRIYRTNERYIVLVHKGLSGSNLSPLIDQIIDGKLLNFDVSIIREDNKKELSRLEKLKNLWDKYKKLNKAKLIITTHGPVKVKQNSINLDLWHGFPLKTMNLMDNNTSKIKLFTHIDHIISLSSTYSTALNACIGIDGGKYSVTGYPRNDYLYNTKGREILEKIIDVNLENKKVVLYMPTYRKTQSTRDSDGDKNYSNFFGFDHFNIEDFNDFLEANDIVFILKLHPNEEEIFKGMYNYMHENLYLLLGETLNKLNVDLYKIVNAADMLITDYSSIYFDYLLLDRPIIFTPVDISSYKEKRGFLFEPYDFWAPGDVCVNYDELTSGILQNLTDDKYSKRRAVIKRLIHKYDDNQSTNRVNELIKTIMNNNICNY